MGKKSRVSVKKQVQAIMKEKTLKKAYLVTHDTTPENASKNAHRMLKDPKIQEQVEKLLDASKPLEISKQNLVKILGTVVARWHQGEETTKDLLKTVELLSRLVPEFASKKEVHSYNHMSEEELDKEISRKYASLLPRRN